MNESVLSIWFQRLRQRGADRRRERYIQSLADEYRQMGELIEWAKHQRELAWQDMTKEINARSPGQVERMERARGLRS